MKMIIAVVIIAARVDKLVQTEADLIVGLPSFLTPNAEIRIPHSHLDGSHFETIPQGHPGLGFPSFSSVLQL
jgi:hypothetical protein